MYYILVQRRTAQMEKWKILNIKIELGNAMLPEGSRFILDHDKDRTPILYICFGSNSQECARTIEGIDEYLSDYYKLTFKRSLTLNAAYRVLTGRLF